jgi:hypothetical protein
LDNGAFNRFGMKELEELYKLLTEKYKDVIWQDLYLFDGYLICEQKKITWTGKDYLMVCLFNSHQDINFQTKEDILSFLQLLWTQYNFKY